MGCTVYFITVDLRISKGKELNQPKVHGVDRGGMVNFIIVYLRILRGKKIQSNLIKSN